MKKCTFVFLLDAYYCVASADVGSVVLALSECEVLVLGPTLKADVIGREAVASKLSFFLYDSDLG